MTTTEAIDVHHHFGGNPLKANSGSNNIDIKIGRHIEMMERNGISGAMLMPPPIYHNTNGLEDTRRVNNQIAELQAQYSGWIPFAAGTVEPSYGLDGFEEVDRLFKELEFDAIMWHSRWQKATPDAPIMYDLIERAATHDAVVILHAIAESTVNDPWRVFKIASDFPDVDFLVLDMFSSGNQSNQAKYEAPEYPNISFDTSLAPKLGRKIENFVDEVGVEQLVFGTDYYYTNPVRHAPEIDIINNTSLTDQEKQAILSGNLKRLLS